MYVQRNTEALSCNYCSSTKAISITYHECMTVALNIQGVKGMRLITICDLFGSTTFFPH